MYIGLDIGIGVFSNNEYWISENRKIDIGTPLQKCANNLMKSKHT